MNYSTISAQPIEIHMPHLLRVIIHQPDSGSTPIDGGLATVFVSDCECLLCTQPSFVGGEKLKVPLYVVQNRVLCVLEAGFDVIEVPL